MNGDYHHAFSTNSPTTIGHGPILAPADTQASITRAKVCMYAMSALLIIGSIALIAASATAAGAAILTALTGVGVVPALLFAGASASCFALAMATAYAAGRVGGNAYMLSQEL